MRSWIDLNSDMGESFGNYQLGRPDEVMKQINHANIACGFHAGDPVWIRRTVESAKRYGVTLGAHPGFPDKMGFGRRLMNITQQEARDYVVYQVGAVKAFADAAGVPLIAAKPHGAFYLWAQQSEENSRAILEGFREVDPEFVAYLPALPRYPMLEVAERMGFRVIKEFYPGLVYAEDGSIGVKRTYGEENIEEMVGLVMKFVTEGTVRSAGGKDIKVDADSICVHGDVINAPEVLTALHKALKQAGVAARSAVQDLAHKSRQNGHAQAAAHA
jgi:5-oxoprolinase (ATP-hydrolysing) subunit A